MRIESVGAYAAKRGLRPGLKILSVQGQNVRDEPLRGFEVALVNPLDDAARRRRELVVLLDVELVDAHALAPRRGLALEEAAVGDVAAEHDLPTVETKARRSVENDACTRRRASLSTERAAAASAAGVRERAPLVNSFGSCSVTRMMHLWKYCCRSANPKSCSRPPSRMLPCSIKGVSYAQPSTFTSLPPA